VDKGNRKLHKCAFNLKISPEIKLIGYREERKAPQNVAKPEASKPAARKRQPPAEQNFSQLQLDEKITIGERVRVYSNDNQAWCDGLISEIQTVTVQYSLPGGPIQQKTLKLKSKSLRTLRKPSKIVKKKMRRLLVSTD
jgi:hypothetical protein